MRDRGGEFLRRHLADPATRAAVEAITAEMRQMYRAEQEEQLTRWAEADDREIHPGRGTSGPASQAAARTLLHNAEFPPYLGANEMYIWPQSESTICGVEVTVTELRAHLAEWLNRAKAGGEVVITDRGIPVARLAGLGSANILERLTAEGVIGAAAGPRPVAAGRAAPRPRRAVADRVSDQRR